MSRAFIVRRGRHACACALVTSIAVATGCFKLDDLKPFPCASDGTCPGGYTCVPSYGCTSTCPSAGPVCTDPNEKCSMAYKADGVTSTPVCVTSGTAAEGQPCTRKIGGVDDCAAGLYCNATVSVGGSFECRRYCTSSSDCAANEACAGVFSVDGKTIDTGIGICAPTCTIGDTSTCGSGRSCKFAEEAGSPARLGAFPVCAADGPNPEWSACTSAAECATGLICDAGFGCVALCDSKSKCDSGRVCSAFSNAPSGVGLCQCDLFGSTCPTGKACTLDGNAMYAFALCSTAGSAPLDSNCTNDASACAPGSACWGTPQAGYRCTSLCDATHPCPTGQCAAIPGVPNHGGVCPS